MTASSSPGSANATTSFAPSKSTPIASRSRAIVGGHGRGRVGVQRTVGEVDEPERQRLGDGRGDVLLPHQVVAEEDGRERITGPTGLGDRDLEVVARQNVPVHQELAQHPLLTAQHLFPSVVVRACIGSGRPLPEPEPDQIPRAQATTRKTSSRLVWPIPTLRSPSSRIVNMPCITAVFWMSSVDRRSMINRSMSSVMSITSWMANRPR